MSIPAVTAVIQPVSHHTAATGLEKISIVWSAFLFIMAIFFKTIWQDHAQKHSSETCYFINKDSSLQSWAY